MKTIQYIFSIAILLMLGASRVFASGETPAPPQDHPIALTNATIHTVSGDIVQGAIVFEKGKITALGESVSIPQGAEVIDLKGKHVYPGMIDACSQLGLVEIEAVRGGNDAGETGEINPNIRPEVAINPESEMLPVTRANGITMALTMPSGGIISGTAAIITLDGWSWEDLRYKAPVGLVIDWPQMTIAHAWWERRPEEELKKERDRQLALIRTSFADARAYLKAKLSEANSTAPYHKFDERWEAMIPVLEGKIPVLVRADEVQQIEAAVAWAARENVKLIIVGGYDAWRVAELLKQNHVAVIVNPIHRLPSRRFEEYDQAALLPKKLCDAGVQFCIAGDGSASNERNIPYHAAMAAGHGLPKEEALKAVTLYPAQILGIGENAGSLETGKDATLIVTSGDPLEISTNVAMEFIQGKKIPLTSRHTRLYEKYKAKYGQIHSGKTAVTESKGK